MTLFYRAITPLIFLANLRKFILCVHLRISICEHLREIFFLNFLSQINADLFLADLR
jgi:hypothetical protein